MGGGEGEAHVKRTTDFVKAFCHKIAIEFTN